MVKLLALRQLVGPARLALRLIRDARVPIYAKVVLALGVLYAITPIDLVPDWIPVLGQLDDIGMAAGALALFVKLSPPEVVEEHQRALGQKPAR